MLLMRFRPFLVSCPGFACSLSAMIERCILVLLAFITGMMLPEEMRELIIKFGEWLLDGFMAMYVDAANFIAGCF